MYKKYVVTYFKYMTVKFIYYLYVLKDEVIIHA